MDDLSRLVAIEAIKSLKSRYLRYVDTKDWIGLRSAFTDDAKIEIPESFDQPFEPDPFVEMVQRALSNAISVHHGHTPEIEILSETEARGIWAMNDHLTYPSADPKATGAAEIGGFGHLGSGYYHERYRREGTEWRITALRLTRLCLQSVGTVRSVR